MFFVSPDQDLSWHFGNLEHRTYWDSFPRRRLFAVASDDPLVDCRDYCNCHR